MHPVTVQFLKNPDITHWGFEAFRLGEDGWGNWIGVPKGAKRWKGESAVRPTQAPAVFCAQPGAWWHLHYNGDFTEFSHFVDIVTPPAWVGEDRYEMIDLDLDVVRRQDGVVEIEDEDEFLVHQVRYGYTPEMVRLAKETTDWVVGQLEEGREPFFAVAASWLERVI
jgi:hypothetical protein